MSMVWAAMSWVAEARQIPARASQNRAFWGYRVEEGQDRAEKSQ
jgi:hypothetical protein